MTKTELINRVRSITRDFNGSVFREIDVTAYINEGIDRISQIVPELEGMTHLAFNTDVPLLLPERYHHLIALYSASRCFLQDERHYQATTLMNEFEYKMGEVSALIESGKLIIVDASGDVVTVDTENDYVENNYFLDENDTIDIDDGVDGV